MNGKEKHQLWGETLRDVGILFFVFAPLDTIIKEGHGTPEDWLFASFIAVVGIIILIFGVILESSR